MQWDPGTDTGIEKNTLSGKTCEIQVSSVLWLIMLFQGEFFSFDKFYSYV